MTIGFGLDLAGFTKRRGTVLATVSVINGTAEATILTDAPFGRKLNGDFSERLICEVKTLRSLLKIGKVAVDVPIDLRGLRVSDVREAWELTLRPIDKKLGALPPLASWLGACVARFKAILSPDIQEELGKQLFETYPAASLRMLFGKNDPDVKQYKLAAKRKAEIACAARKSLVVRLKIDAKSTALTHDELDAVICAITAVASDKYVWDERSSELSKATPLPDGYRLLRSNPFTKIVVGMEKYDYWMRQTVSR